MVASTACAMAATTRHNPLFMAILSRRWTPGGESSQREVDMPYCVRCASWFPGRATACERCGGALGPERPAPDGRGPEEMMEDVWSTAEATAILPDREAEVMQPDEMRSLVSALDVQLVRARGRHAAPVSWLPATPRRVATALELALEEAEDRHDWPAIRHVREDIVDLQAFLPDDETAAAEAFVAGSDGPVSGDGAAALNRVKWAQAMVISMLRDDDRVLGAHNALSETEVVIGQAQRSLEAVDHYKETQASGIAAIVVWPAGLVVGFAVGTLLAGLSVVAAITVFGLAIAGYALFLAPAFGSFVGGLASRLDRLAMRAENGLVVQAGRGAASVVWYVLFFGGPVAIGFFLTVGIRGLGLP